MKTTWLNRAGRWTCYCGCEFTSRAVAEEHDQFACTSTDGAGAVVWALASLVVVIMVVLWVIFG